MYRFSLAFILLLACLPSYAHIGHDHNEPLASFFHLVWLAPLLIGAIYLINRLVKFFNLLGDNR